MAGVRAGVPCLGSRAARPSRNRIDKGFNTDLFVLKEELEAFTTPETGGISRALDKVNALIEVWDTKPVYFQASPANDQAISAAQFADRIENLLTSARSAVGSEEDAVEKLAKEAEPELLSEPEPTPEPKAKAKEQPKREQPRQQAESKTKQQAEPKTKQQQPKTKEKKPPSKESAQQENELRAAANREKKAQLEAKRSTVKLFSVVLTKETTALTNSEKITWSERGIELKKIIDVALSRVVQAPAPSTVLNQAYEEWTELIERKRTTNEFERRRTREQWQTWTGLDNYRIAEPSGAAFTEAVRPPPPAPGPVEGPMTAEGLAPAEPEVEPEVPARLIPIHVTYDRDSVAAPTQSINGMEPAAVLNHQLAGPATWQRIHATLEAHDGLPTRTCTGAVMTSGWEWPDTISGPPCGTATCRAPKDPRRSRRSSRCSRLRREGDRPQGQGGDGLPDVQGVRLEDLRRAVSDRPHLGTTRGSVDST